MRSGQNFRFDSWSDGLCFVRFLTVETLGIKILVYSNDGMEGEVHYLAKVASIKGVHIVLRKKFQDQTAKFQDTTFFTDLISHST